jgi:hypothetical protein
MKKVWELPLGTAMLGVEFGRPHLALFEKWLTRVVPSPKVVQPALGVCASELVVQNDNRPAASYVKRDSSYQWKTSMIAKPGKATRNGRFRKLEDNWYSAFNHVSTGRARCVQI